MIALDGSPTIYTVSSVAEQALPGGFHDDSAVHQGALVLKRAPDDPEFVGALLRLLEESNYPHAPRWRGLRPDGRAAYTFVPGHVPWSRPEPEPRGVYGKWAKKRVFRMIRRLHDLTAGSDLAAGHEVVVHGDLAYFNTVYQRTAAGTYLPVAFIDWDLARPGTRVEDIAHAIWQFLSLGDPETDRWSHRHPRMIAECCDWYGLDGRADIVDAIIFEQQRTVDGQKKALAAGALSNKLIETDAIAKVHRMLDWTMRHRDLYGSEL